MAANIVWFGGTDGELDKNANWIGGVKPGDTDSAFFGTSYDNAPNANMDGLADTLALVHVGQGVPYDIGADGDPMKVQCDKWVHNGDGKLWMDFDGDVDSDLFVNCGPGGSIDVAGTVTTGRLHLLAGNINLAGGLTITNDVIEVGPDAIVTIGALTNVIDYYEQWSSPGRDPIVTCSKGMTIGHIKGGRISLLIAGDTFAKLVVSNALVSWKAGSTITTAVLEAGAILDSRVSGKTQTLTTVYRYKGSVWRVDSGITQAGTDHNYGGTTE
jgi:hypothetical protein